MERDAIRGALVGLAVGDILGCPYENEPRAEVERLFGVAPSEPIVGLPAWPAHEAPRPNRWRLRGLHSDDTQQALTIAESLMACGRLDAADLLARWKAMAEASVPFWDPDRGLKHAPLGAHRGIGGSLRSAVRGEVDAARPSYGDGAAMRVAPIGLLYQRDPARRVAAAAESAWVSHRHPHAVGAAAAVAAAVAAALDPGSGYASVLECAAVEADQATALVADRLGAAEAKHVGDFGAAVRMLLPLQGVPVADGLAQVQANARRVLNDTRRPITATTSQAIAAGVAALWLAARSLEDYRAAVLSAINAEGDTDTVAAMVGSVVGARVGLTGIPAEWRAELIGLSLVLQLADRLAGDPALPGAPTVLAWETRWTRLEMLARQGGRIVRRIQAGRSPGKRCKP